MRMKASERKGGKCRDCAYLLQGRDGNRCKHFGNPFERDLRDGDGCDQFFKRKPAAYRAELKLKEQEISRWTPLMNAGEIDYDAHGIAKFATCDMWTADFGNGIIADLKVCASDTDEPLWCECVFFRVDGNTARECACTDVSDTLTGAWSAEIDGDTYTVVVSQE